MILSLNQKPSLSPSYIKRNLIRRHLTDSTLNKAEIFNQMKRFIDLDVGELMNLVGESQKIKVIEWVLSVIQKQLKDKSKTNWMKTFAIHAFFKFFILNCGEKKLLFQSLLEQIGNIKTQITEIKDPSLNSGLLSRSLSKIKRSLSTKSLKGMFGSSQSQKKPNNLNDLQHQILVQYVSYLQKLLHDWFQMEQFLALQKSPQSAKSRPTKSKEEQTNLVWKVYNIFKKLTKICKDFLRINQLLEDYTVYFYSMMNFISEDIEMLYNPVVDVIRSRMRVIPWEKTMRVVENKERHYNSFNIPTQQIVEIHSMVEELGNINEVVLHVFLGCFHYKYLYNKSRPSNFVSINEVEFDKVYAAVKFIEEERKKSQFLENKFSLKIQRELKDPSSTQDRVSMTSRNNQNKMKAVNYKSSKLRQMHSETLKKI